MGYRFTSAFASLVALIAFALPAHAQVVPTGSWTAKASNTAYGTPYMYYGGWASNGTYLYYWGSSTSSLSAWQELRRYDPASDSWWQSPFLLPNPVSYPGGGAHVAGELFSFGNTQSAYYGQILRYSISGDSWSTVTLSGAGGSLTNSPHDYRGACVAVGSYIYVAGGYDQTAGANTNALSRFDPSSNTLVAQATVPVSAQQNVLSYSPTSGHIYYSYGTGMYEYNISTNQWTTKTSCPVSRSYHTAFETGGRIYLVGGNQGTRLDEYNPMIDGSGTNPWTVRATCFYSHGNHPGAGVIGSKVYVCGGSSNNSVCEEYTPPDFGKAPNDATNVAQVGSLGVTPEAGTDPNVGWTDAGITFQADVSDPDVGQQVALVVQVKSASAGWGSATTLQSPLGGQGPHAINYPIPTGGDYHWRYRTIDAYGNVAPAPGGIPGWTEFGATGTSTHVDFRSDQVAPTVPVMVYPINQDVLVPSLIAGDVTLVWNGASDNGPLTAITYTVEVAHDDPAFGTTVANGSGIASTQATFNLAVSRYNYYWRVGSTDIGGNFSGLPLTGSAFRVVGDDSINHGSGDGARVMGCSALAGAAPGAAAVLAAGLVLMGALARRR